VKVLIARAPGPKKWTKFHRDPNCSGLRKGEIADGAQYVLRDLDDLPDTVEPCRFDCCFPGSVTTADLRTRGAVNAEPKPARDVRVGHEVEFRNLATGKAERRRIVQGSAKSPDELSAEAPIAKGLLGHEPGEVVDIELPSGKVIRVEIVSAADPAADR